DTRPGVLAVDELRGDESPALWPLLASARGPRCLLVLRSSLEPERLRNVFTMIVRKGQPELAQAAINDVLTMRVPFVVMVRSAAAGLHVQGIHEWVVADTSSGGVTLRALVADGQLVGNRPEHPLALADEFWAT
ncbi:hypothetical protein ACFLYO_05840, partial [Chloroflexota bacterium]